MSTHPDEEVTWSYDDEAIATQLGRLVMAWSRIEWLLLTQVANLVSPTQPPRALVALERTPVSRLLLVLERLRPSLDLSPADLVALDAWRSAVDSARIARNNALHKGYARISDDDDWAPVRFQWKRDPKTGLVHLDSEGVTAADIEAALHLVKKAGETWETLSLAARGMHIPGTHEDPATS